MSRICPQCKVDFVPFRRDQKYCGHSCRQKDYINRKYGSTQNLAENNASATAATPEVVKEDPKKHVSLFERLLSGLTANPTIDSNQLITQLGQLIGMICAGAPINSIIPGSNESPSKPVNDGSQLNDGKASKGANDALTDKMTDDPKRPVFSSKNNASQNSGREGSGEPSSFCAEEMVKNGLTDCVNLDSFTKERYRDWTDQQWKAAKRVNQQFFNIINGLLQYGHYRDISKSRLKKIVGELEDFQTGIYSLLLPANYPYFGYFKKLELKLREFLSRIPQNDKRAELKISSSMVHELIFIKLQIGNAITSTTGRPP